MDTPLCDMLSSKYLSFSPIVCSAGYGGTAAGGGAGCIACSEGKYKSSAGNGDCTDIPQQSTVTTDRTNFGNGHLCRVGWHT